MVWSNITQSEWDIPNYTELSSWALPKEEATTVASFALFFLIARNIFQTKVAQWAKSRGIQKGYKLSESMFKGVFYLTAFSWGMYELSRSDYYPNTINCWTNYPHAAMPYSVKMLYLFELGYYFHALFAHFVMETKRSDFWPLFFHHVVTIWLIYFSYILRYWRIGHLVLLVHDINDIPLEFGKVLIYMGYQMIPNILFVFLLISWVTSRLGLLPFKIINSTWYEAIQAIPSDVIPFYHAFNYALMSLVCLHVYWFGLLLKVGYRTITKGEIKDHREEKLIDGGKKVKKH